MVTNSNAIKHPVIFFLAALFSCVFSMTSASVWAKTSDSAKPEAKAKGKTDAETSKKDKKSMSNTQFPVVVVTTSLGSFDIELNSEKAPITVKNFLEYVDKGFYNGTIFHRVISNFMIQGGGFTPDMNQKPTGAQIKNEAKNGLKNSLGTVAMARTNVVDSATAQFFINVKDNDFLNHQDDSNYGYAVFGKVTSGMDTVEKIKKVPTTMKAGHQDVPATPVVIESIRRK